LIAAVLLPLLQVEPIKIDSKKATPEIRAAIGKLDAIRVDAFTKAVAAIEARIPEEHKVILKAIDAVDPDPAKFERHTGFSVETSSVSDVEVEIRFFVEYFANGMLRPEETLRHEMVHAAMRLDLGQETYRKIPKWLREGIAVHLAKQTSSKLAYQLALSTYATEPEKLVDGLADDNHSLDDYAEDGLAIEYLLSLAGKDGLARLEDKLREKSPYKDAIAALTQKPFDKFEAGAKEYALKAVRELAAKHKAELDLYREILVKNPTGGPECDRFLRTYSKSPFRSAVLYFKAKGAGDEGLPHFEKFIASAREPGGMAGLIDDAMLRRARLLVKKGKSAEASTQYAEIVMWHVGSGSADDALFEWGILLHPTDRARAIPLLRRALAISPKHKLAEEAKKLLAEGRGD
jgi:hypothetical protein